MCLWHALLLLGAATLGSAADEGALPPYRLPGDVLPRHYDLKVLTHLTEKENFTYMGTVNIQLDIVRDTKLIVLHSRDLHVNKEGIKIFSLGDNRSNQVVNVSCDRSLEFLKIQVNDFLKVGSKWELSIPFQGFLQEALVGFYRSSYKNSHTGEREWLATTQFESTYARRAFPCFDEPSMKATYSVTLGRKEGLTSISNMPLEESKPIEGMKGWYWDRFQKSVPMSTYLLAFIISQFNHVVSPKSDNNVVFKIWARSDAINQTTYASQVGPTVLSFFEKYYNIPYPLPKQDMVAIPDFNAGAMENWGIITYRETALLYSDTTSSTTSKARVATVIAHELAHQWFGNLVTMKWWTDLWLNEGFATYMATLGVDHVHPDWNILQEDSADNLVEVFKLDALDNSHPVSVPIGDPSEIAQIFDAISYKKGSAIIRMMNLFLGEQVFREGVSHYLTKYKYNNAEQDDLWQSLTEAAHKANVLAPEYTVKTIMDSWTKQTGYPLITVTRNYSDNTALISQIRYQGKKLSTRSVDLNWWVPLSYWRSDTPRPRDQAPNTWLPGVRSLVIQQMPNKDKWVLFNIDMSGVYRVNYDEHNWELLTAAMSAPQHSDFSQLNRFQLISDAMALAWSNQLHYKSALGVLKYLDTEENYLPWKAALSSLGRISRILERMAEYGVFRDYFRQILATQYDKMGGLHSKKVATSEKLDVVKHMVLISSWSCKMDISDCVQIAKEFFTNWMNEASPDIVNPVPKDLRGIVYCTGVSTGGQKEWEFLFQRYTAANVASEKETIMSGLSCTKQIWLLNRLLDLSITKDGPIRKQDATATFSYVGNNHVGYYVARDFLYSRISDIAKHHKGELSVIARYVKTIAGQITSQHELKEFSRWVEENKAYLKDSLLAVKQALESVSITLDWVNDHKETVVQVLKDLTV